MESLTDHKNIIVHYETAYKSVAVEVLQSFEKAEPILIKKWGPRNSDFIVVYICNSPIDFVFSIATGILRLLWKITYPLWARKLELFYNRAGGVTMHIKSKSYIWLRPPDAYDYVEKTIGKLLFGKIEDRSEKLQFVFVHELTHAHIGNRKLPTWINEGIAMITVDEYFSKCTVLESTLTTLFKDHRNYNLVTYRKMANSRPIDIAFTYTYGYWATRYIEEVYPNILMEALTKNLKKNEFTRFIFDIMGINDICGQIANDIYTHFENYENE